jgi:non-specific serine/threonine protein kinase
MSFPDFDMLGFVHGLAAFAALAAAERMPSAALRLAGATTALTRRTGIAVQHSDRWRNERWLPAARQLLGEETAMAAWAEGQAMQLDQAIAYALSPGEPVPATRSRRAAGAAEQQGAELTSREWEITALLAHGLTNRQIAERLVITERTVGAHIGHILDKLGFNSRHQVSVWASEHGVLD